MIWGRRIARSSSIFRTRGATLASSYVVASAVVFAMPYAYLEKERCIRRMKPREDIEPIATKRVIPMHVDGNIFVVDELRAKAMLASRCLFRNYTSYICFDKAN